MTWVLDEYYIFTTKNVLWYEEIVLPNGVSLSVIWKKKLKLHKDFDEMCRTQYVMSGRNDKNMAIVGQKSLVL